MQKVLRKLRANIPLLLILLVGSFIALQNTSIRGFYSGWDNIHAELDLGQYAYRVLFGAWKEHQGLGGPAAKAHLAEITRIPYLFLLQQIFPTYLVRAAFLFTMYLIGGTTMYFFVKNWWLEKHPPQISTWVAGFAGLLYMLHPLTLQQFYISFELFTVQFAFFPLVLITIHLLAQKLSAKHLLYFSLVQVLIASSAHTPTVYYLGAVISVLYALGVALHQKKTLVKTLLLAFIVGVLSFVMNAFWIVPNLYYSFNNSEYVTESKANIVFGPEALWSIRESSTLNSFLSGYHYLTTWKDYNFSTGEHELIFNEWQDTFSHPFRVLQLYALAALTVVGTVVALTKFRSRTHASLAALIYLLTSAFIWIELFPTKNFLLQLYENKTFLEIFRNPFTKLSILHSIFVVLLAVEALSFLIRQAEKKLTKKAGQTVLGILLILSYTYTLSITPLSFSGNFINEKLMVIFPDSYENLYTFMKTLDHEDRVLEMPYTSREGWVLYNWSTENRVNGYQGIGFYFFGIPQPFLTSDFARWSGVNDYFYEELAFALNSKNPSQLEKITTKYHVPLVILDESRETPYRDHDFGTDRELLQLAGFEKIWEENFITVYEHPKIATQSNSYIAPQTVSHISARTDRVTQDPAYNLYKDYISEDETTSKNTIQFPFSWLLQSELTNHTVTQNGSIISTQIPTDTYKVLLPPLAGETYKTTVAIRKNQSALEIFFPQYTLETDADRFILNTIPNSAIEIEPEDFFAVGVNNTLLSLNDEQFSYLEVNVPVGQNITITDAAGVPLIEIPPNWEDLTAVQEFIITQSSELKITTAFPTISANLTLQPSENCVTPQRGSIQTTYNETGAATYEADEFGVNCNSVSVPYMSPAHSYIVTSKGENLEGRSIKLFVHYSMENTTHTEYIFPEEKYEKHYPLKELTQNAEERLYLNWETRSFGKKSVNRLDSLEFIPFHLETFSEIQLLPQDRSLLSGLANVPNNLEVLDFEKKFVSRYSAKVNCLSETCYFGLNQAYDDAWIAVDTSSWSLLSHKRYNNWANIWEIPQGERSIEFIYIPQCIAFGFLILGTSTIIFFFGKTLRKRKK